MAKSGRGSSDLLGDRYRLLGPIGYGGMSAVYVAEDTALGREVAVKVFKSGTVDDARQQSEIAVLAKLDHHGIVGVFDAGAYRDADGRQHRYIVMSLVRGQTLRERLRGPRLMARNIAEIGYDLAEALEYVHLNGVTHRDVKPSNILLVDYGNTADRMRAKLSDFGIALTEDADPASLEGQTTGTVAYLSPEQAGGGPVGPASDIYSLGLVLLQCFTRSLEYPGTPGESAVARLARDPVVPEALPDRWRQLLTSMTAMDAGARPTARDLVSALRQIAVAESGRHRDDDDPIVDEIEAVDRRAADQSGVVTERNAVEQGTDGPSAVDQGTIQGAGQSSDVIDPVPNETLHRVTAMAARLFGAPLAAVSMRDGDRTRLVSHYGEDIERITRLVDISHAAPPSDEPVVIEDAGSDPRMIDSPLTASPVGLRFYVGVPLQRADGTVIGTLSVADFEPGMVSATALANLRDLAALAVAQLELPGTRSTPDVGVDS